MDKSHSAFVLSLFDTGLGAIRSLGRLGIPVIGCDSDPNMPGFKSNFCDAKLCPDPVHRPEELIKFLQYEGEKLKQPGILFPASDAFVLFVSRYRNALSTNFRFILPPEHVLESIVNKRRQYELADYVKTPYPRTFYPETVKDVLHIKDQIEYPAFIKPYYSHLWREKFGTIKGFKVYTPEELIDYFQKIIPSGIQVMVQSLILGPNTNHYKVNVYMNSNGTPLAVFTLRKIRQFPTDFGVGSMVESIYYKELADIGLTFFKGIGYRGIGSIEFKKDERDGQLKMIELNPRLWQQNYLATVCGINFPLIQYLDLTGEKLQPQTIFLEKIKWFDEFADFKAFWDYFRRGELSPLAWLRSFRGVKAFATFAFDDMRPFLAKNQYGIKYLKLPLYLLRHRK